MWWFFINICFGIWAVLDAKKRKESMLLPGLSFLLVPIVLPIYMAKRNLREGEVREGGQGWNILKNFALYWTIVCIVWGISGLFLGASIETVDEYEAAGVAIGTGIGIILIAGLWFCGTVGALLVGFFLKKSTVVEKGPTGALADNTEVEYNQNNLDSEIKASIPKSVGNVKSGDSKASTPTPSPAE